MDYKIKKFQKNAYADLYILENILRIGIHSYFVDKEGEDYFNSLKISPNHNKDDFQKTLNYRIKNRNAAEKSFNHFFWYIDLPILIEIIRFNWNNGVNEVFQSKTSSDYILTILNDIIHIRNSIAHNRSITKEDSYKLRNTKNEVNKYIKNKYLKGSEIIISCDYATLRETLNDNIVEAIKNIKNNMILKNDMITEIYFCLIKTKIKLDVQILYEDMRSYNRIPRFSDYGEEVKKFVKEKKIILSLEKILEQL